jgi:signal transduction histidine kinase/ligand-binding sensor domain-containing protein
MIRLRLTCLRFGIGIATLLGAAVMNRAVALEPGTALKQAQHTAWGLQDGAPNRIFDIAQTSDGFLWLASPTGLYRFDGQHFIQNHFPNNPSANWDVTALTATENNELWVGSRRHGIVHYKSGAAIQTYGTAEGIPASTVYSIRKDSSGQMWAASVEGVFALHDGHWNRVWPADGTPSRPAANLWMDRAGTLCFTTDNAVVCKSAGNAEFSDVLQGPVEDIALAPDGQFWVWLSGIGIRPLHTAGSNNGTLQSTIPHGHMVFAPSGDLFVLTYGHGLTHFSRTRPEGEQKPDVWNAEEFNSQDGLQSNYLSALFEDREGNLWVGGTRGLERFRNGKFVGVTTIGASPSTVLLPDSGDRMWAGLRTEPLGFVTVDNQREPFTPSIAGVTAAYQDHDASSWFGTSPWLWHVSKGKASPIRLPEYVQGSSDIQAITRDQDGALWVSVVRYGVLRLDHGVWSRPDVGIGPDENATMLYCDDESRIWMSFHGRVVVVEGTAHRVLGANSGLTFGDVMSFAGRGSLLVAGGERGIGVFDGSHFKPILTDHDGLLTNVSGLLFSADGALWAHGSTALFRIAPADLSDFLSGKVPRVKSQTFTFADGLPGLAPLVRPLPSVVLGPDGRIWVTTTSGIAWLDPLHYPKNRTPPTVVLQNVRADGQEHAASPLVDLPPRTRSITISYTAPSLSVADGVHFRYRLEGFDSDWQEAGSRRSAFYTALLPGQYRFHVIAANEDMVWNEVGDALEIRVAPAFYQTLPFRIIIWALGLFTLWIAYRTRLRLATERVRDLLAERLAERERIAGELHDTLLQSVQGLILLFHGISLAIPTDNPLSEKIDTAIGRAQDLLEEGRDSVRDLRSSSFSLEEALRGLGTDFRGSASRFEVIVQGEQPELQLLVCDEVFKLAREAVRNALQHACAETVQVRLTFRNYAIELRILDNGSGMSEDLLLHGRPGHWGLLGMRERARKLRAELNINSKTGNGTSVELFVPASVAYRNMVPGLRALVQMYWARFSLWVHRRLHRDT